MDDNRPPYRDPVSFARRVSRDLFPERSLVDRVTLAGERRDGASHWSVTYNAGIPPGMNSVPFNGRFNKHPVSCIAAPLDVNAPLGVVLPRRDSSRGSLNVLFLFVAIFMTREPGGPAGWLAGGKGDRGFSLEDGP